VAREMHDSLGKTLHGMALSAAAVARLVPEDPERAATRANELAEGARSAADEARELIRDLRADRLAQPLHEAVRAFVQEWSETAGVDAEVEVEPVPVRSPEARYEVFSVLREALENVRRHAAAKTVTVALRRDGDGAALTVCDDGCGASRGVLEGASRDGHFGLVGMHERAERLGGRLEIAGAPGEGTTIRALLPADPQVLDPIALPERELV
jgi:signal transduction histidine kinase